MTFVVILVMKVITQPSILLFLINSYRDESVTESFQKKHKETLTLQNAYKPPVWNTHKEVEAI